MWIRQVQIFELTKFFILSTYLYSSTYYSLILYDLFFSEILISLFYFNSIYICKIVVLSTSCLSALIEKFIAWSYNVKSRKQKYIYIFLHCCLPKAELKISLLLTGLLSPVFFSRVSPSRLKRVLCESLFLIFLLCN